MRWSKSPLTQPMCRSADRRTTARASTSITIVEVAIEPVESKPLDVRRDTLDDRGGKRDLVGVAAHERDRGAIGVCEDRVTGQQHPPAVRAGRPVHDRATRKMAAGLGHRDAGQDLHRCRPGTDHRIGPRHPREIGSPRRTPAHHRGPCSIRPGHRTCAGGSPRSPLAPISRTRRTTSSSRKPIGSHSRFPLGVRTNLVCWPIPALGVLAMPNRSGSPAPQQCLRAARRRRPAPVLRLRRRALGPPVLLDADRHQRAVARVGDHR